MRDDRYVGDSNATPLCHMKVAVEYMMYRMNTNDMAATRQYEYMSESNRELNTARNKRASNSFRNIWSEKMNSDQTWEWWNSKTTPSSLTLNGIVIILDEVGKDMQFAYGVVEEAHNLLSDMISSKKANTGKIVIVGAGLDDFPLRRNSLFSFSTDPTLAKVIVMQTPNKDVLVKYRGVSQDDLSGTYTRVLSDNARMLMLGVVPCLTTEFLTDHYRDSSCDDGPTAIQKRTKDRILCGSFGPLMQYSCRIYVQNFGLCNLSSEDRLKTLLELFQLCLQRSLENVMNNHNHVSNAASRLKKSFPSLDDGREYRLIRYGLFPATPTKFPSNAIKFLACNGCVPVNAGNVSFEDLVEMHLYRLYSLNLEKVIVLNFKLVEAWPPTMNTGAYKQLKPAETITLPILDKKHIAELKKLRKVIYSVDKKKVVHVIMRQSSVQDAHHQGPNLFFLSLDFGNKKTNGGVIIGTLDIFQVKNSCIENLNQMHQWLCPHGIVMPNDDDDYQGKDSVECTNQSIEGMIEQLNTYLGPNITITLGKRCIVINQNAEEVQENVKVQAVAGKVDLWTSDFLDQY